MPLRPIPRCSALLAATSRLTDRWDKGEEREKDWRKRVRLEKRAIGETEREGERERERGEIGKPGESRSVSRLVFGVGEWLSS